MSFRALHESGCFVIPNPWDRGSARFLAHAGFKALASSSAGFAFSQGLPDKVSALPRDNVLDHLRDIVAATPLPVNADFQNGYADEPQGVARNVRLCAATGVAGLSIEDATGRADPLYELPLAIDRIAAARAALDGTEVLLTARAECFLVGHPDPLAESIRRLQAYSEAGADVLYAPGLRNLAEVRQVVDAVNRPVNVVTGWLDPDITLAQLGEAGAKRISVGGALSRLALATFISAANAMKDEGSFAWKRDMAPIANVWRLLNAGAGA